ncbi:hypothetical protein DMR_30410 [Solidesulfovibrio magneticus RS-1]|uniref:Uncharacterized protein n=1 Tax=Solidesulfovibrio magneticus (strain ATCC 700980 / DSM 13731 / RS-1) TaxID=573370 RepID=C4XIF7_SOLM1|nr:hypothetical protein DMR_30410 [Solidesulfovibrio magneticus RS-1]
MRNGLNSRRGDMTLGAPCTTTAPGYCLGVASRWKMADGTGLVELSFERTLDRRRSACIGFVGLDLGTGEHPETLSAPRGSFRSIVIADVS